MYALELVPRYGQPRYLTGISHSGINFNITGGLTFSSVVELESFRLKWKSHFFDLKKLSVTEVQERN